MPENKETDKKNLSDLYHDLNGLAGFIENIIEKSDHTDLNNNLRLMKHKLLKAQAQMIEEVVKDVMGIYLPAKKEEIKQDINLGQAVAIINEIERKAVLTGLSVVIAVYNSAARPVAIHCMDDSYIAGFDVAVNKAYTSAALKMSTAVLKNLCQPGQELYGIQNTNQGKIVIFGGGEPLYFKGRLIGALGVSGGTEEEDRELAAFGRNKLEEVMMWR